MIQVKKTFALAAVAATSFAVSAFAADEVVETVTQPVPAQNQSAYPVTQWDRPSFLPQNSFEVSVGGKMKKFNAESFTGTIGLSYGIAPKVQLDLEYQGTELNRVDSNKRFVAGRTLEAGVTTAIWGNSFMSLKGNVVLPLHFEQQVVKDVYVNLPLSFSPAERLGIKFFHAEFIGFNFENKFGMEFGAPVKISYQVADRVLVEAGTKLATLKVLGEKGFAASKWIATETPVKAGVNVAITNWMDVEANAGFGNAQNPADTFNAGIGLAFRGGALNG